MPAVVAEVAATDDPATGLESLRCTGPSTVVLSRPTALLLPLARAYGLAPPPHTSVAPGVPWPPTQPPTSFLMHRIVSLGGRAPRVVPPSPSLGHPLSVVLCPPPTAHLPPPRHRAPPMALCWRGVCPLPPVSAPPLLIPAPHPCAPSPISVFSGECPPPLLFILCLFPLPFPSLYPISVSRSQSPCLPRCAPVLPTLLLLSSWPPRAPPPPPSPLSPRPPRSPPLAPPRGSSSCPSCDGN